jgi:hypothetical protein
LRKPRAEEGWFAFAPKSDGFDSVIDLRRLNEKFAGQHGFIGVKGSDFVHGKNSEQIRFWAVNGPPNRLKGEELRRSARVLAKYGVNLARIHGGYFNETGEVDMAKVRHAQEIVEAMKEQGIYSYFSIYFPLWFSPKPDNRFLKGYNGEQHPFAALFFNPEFQEQYRAWWKALLTTPNEKTGKRLIDDPAVAGVEMQNEDSFFFWTFAEKNLPAEQWALLETQFGSWLKKKYGSITKAFEEWKGLKVKGDDAANGRVAFRPLWNMFNEKTARDQDTAEFMAQTQRHFYDETYQFLRGLGFRGVITASNWSTASPEVFGPIEKWSYAGGDFIDRHGYFSCYHKGPNSEWSIRDGHTYRDRSALRFDAMSAEGSKQFVHPVMDPEYNGKPSMISETTWNRPNRYRSEAPLYYACYGALQGSDAIVHFAFDGAKWSVKPGYWMQPWTLMTPAMMGQFPAAALIYRKGLVHEGKVLAKVNLATNSLFQLTGTPLPQDATLDELRLKDVPQGGELKKGERIDPLIHYAGKTKVEFGGSGGVHLEDLRPFIDHKKEEVASSTGELKLNYGKGTLVIDAPGAQGVEGNLKLAGAIETKDFVFESDLDLGAMAVVALDDQPLSKSSKMLLQVISEEKPSGFETTAAGEGVKRIVSIGKDPWLVRNLEGSARCKRADAEKLTVTALGQDGTRGAKTAGAEEIRLLPSVVYYLLEAPETAGN